MDTGIDAGHLYSACKLTLNHLYAENDHRYQSFGTGFIVQFPPGDPRYGLVTNRHLTDRAWVDPAYEGTELESVHVVLWISEDLRVEFTVKNPDVLYHSDPSVDVSVIRLGLEDHLDLVGYPFANIEAMFPNPDAAGFTFQHALSWEYLISSESLWPQLEPGEFVVFPGYPIWYDKSEIRPVLRSGVIASDPQRNYRKLSGPPNCKDGNFQVLFDAFSTSGNSGSPVFVAQRGATPVELRWATPDDTEGKTAGRIEYSKFHKSFLIGINAGHFNDTDSDKANDHAGLSRMHKLSTILEILRDHTGVCDGDMNITLRIRADLVEALGGISEPYRARSKELPEEDIDPPESVEW